MTTDTPTHTPKPVRRIAPMTHELPVYLKSSNNAIYKITSPNGYVMACKENGSVDIRVRQYATVVASIYEEYLSGDNSYTLSTAEEFEALFVNVNKRAIAAALV